MASPTKSTLDTNLQLGQQAVTLSTSQNDYNPGAYGCIGVSATAAGVHITGMIPATNGQLRAVVYDAAGGNTFTLDHESASSSAANRQQIAGANITLGTARKGMLLIYDEQGPSGGRWYKVS